MAPPFHFQSHLWLRGYALQAMNGSEGKREGTSFTGAQGPAKLCILPTCRNAADCQKLDVMGLSLNMHVCNEIHNRDVFATAVS